MVPKALAVPKVALPNNITVAKVALEDLEALVATKAAPEVTRVVLEDLAVPVAKVVTRADLEATEATEALADPADLREE